MVDHEYRYRAGQFQLRNAHWLDDCCEPLLENQPHVVGLSTLADTLPTVLLMGRRLKEMAPEVTVVLGGPGTFGAFPGLLSEFADAADFVCQGEGELALAELVTALADGTDPYRVSGLWSWRDGALNHRGGQLPTNLDLIPMPAYQAVPMEDYLRMASPRIFDMHIGSGCTYACKFCMTSTFWDRDFRAKSPEVVLRELDWLHERYGITRVNFLHDNFANKRRYLENFVEYFTEHNTRYEWGCAVRPDNVTAEIVGRMREAGCFNIFCGTDAGSEKILRQMQKMPNSRRIYQFFAACRDIGMPFETNTIVGYPNEAPEDLEASLEVILDAVAYGATSSDLSVLQPLPGAEVTADYLDHLEPLSTQVLGTFLPPEVTTLVTENLTRFPGFAFIRKDNRDYPYYAGILRLARFFTRRYYFFLRFLKQVCGLRYVDAFERLLGTVSTDVAAALPALLTDLPEPRRRAAQALWEYERALDALRPGDVLAELDNVYLDPTSRAERPGHVALELPVDITRIIEDPARLVLPETALVPTAYLIHGSRRGELTTLRLLPWHRTLLAHLQEYGDIDVAATAAGLAAATGASEETAMERVTEVVAQIRTALAA